MRFMIITFYFRFLSEFKLVWQACAIIFPWLCGFPVQEISKKQVEPKSLRNVGIIQSYFRHGRL
jgi:hypothetical protein